MGWLDSVGSGAMSFPHGETVYRQRPAQVWDPLSQTNIRGDWSTLTETEIAGAFIAQSSTSILGDATRTQALEAKSLYCDPDTDIRKGDRVRQGTDVYTVDGIPAADTNPWTGWRPVREVPLVRGEG